MRAAFEDPDETTVPLSAGGAVGRKLDLFLNRLSATENSNSGGGSSSSSSNGCKWCCGTSSPRATLCGVIIVLVVVLCGVAVLLTTTSQWENARRLGVELTADLTRVASLQDRYTAASLIDNLSNDVYPSDAVLGQGADALNALNGWVDVHPNRLDWSLALDDGLQWYSTTTPTVFLWAQVIDMTPNGTRRFKHLPGSPYSLGADLEGTRKENLPAFITQPPKSQHIYYTVVLHTENRDWLVTLH